MSKFLKVLSLVTLMIWVLSGITQAATTGKLQGTVRDAQTGEFIPGANVVLDGTQRGATTDVNGYYMILLIEPGTYTMTASMVGYNGQKKTDVLVQSDFTTTVDFTIRETTLELGEITVVAERPPVEPDKTTSQYIMSSEDLEAVPIVRNMTDFVELQAGVSIDAEGDDIMIRAGDRNDVAYVIDGVRVNTTDSRDTRTGLGRGINKSAIQELQVITGGYNAEYGNAQGGVVSLVTRDGGSTYSGMIDYQFTPAGQKHWGANAYDSPVHRGNNKWDDADWVAQSIEIPADLDGDGFNDIVQAHKRIDYTGEMGHRFEGNVSGPLTKDLTFFASSRWNRTAASFPDAQMTTPFNTSNTLKLTYGVSPELKVRVGGVFDRRKGIFSGPALGGRLDLRENGRNIFMSVADPTGHYIETDEMFYAGMTHSLSPKTFYEVTLSYSATDRDTTDMPVHYATADYLTSNITNDGYYTIYRETTNWSQYTYQRLILKADLSSQINKQNFVKTGFEITRYTNWYQQYWSDGPTHRRLRWFSKDYTSSAFWPGQENKGLTPTEAGLYIQDKIEFEGLILNAGVRGDIFFQNEMKDVDAWYGMMAPWNGMTRSTTVPTAKGPAIKSFQPRIGVSHPITEKSLVRFFYGKFTQRPQFHEMFQNEWASVEAKDRDTNNNGVIDPAEKYNDFNDAIGAGTHGTRFLPPEETVSFEVGLDWNFVSNYVLGLTTYYKQSSNQVVTASQQWINPESNVYRDGQGGFAPGDWKDARGFEINLRKKFSNMFSFNVGYNLQWADGGRNSAHRRDVWPDSQLVANGYYWVDYDVDPTTGAEIPVSLVEKARRQGRADDYYIALFGHNANVNIQTQQTTIDGLSSWSWIPWYSHYSAEGVKRWVDQDLDNSEYGDDDKAYWEKASEYPGNPGSGEGNLLVGHNQETGERAPLAVDRRNFGSITFLFATPALYGPFGGKVIGNVRSNLVYRLYAGARFSYTTGGIRTDRYGPLHTRMDFNLEKVFGSPSDMNITLAMEVYNLFNQKDNRQNALSGRAVDFNTDRYQLWGVMGLEPTNANIATLGLTEPEINDLGNYWDSPREMNFSVRIKW